jgi:hypothetical protein
MRKIEQQIARIPKLLRFLAAHALIGAAAGTVAGVALIATNTAGLYDLMAASNTMAIASFMLVSSFALTFAGASVGTAVMLLPRDRQDH